MKVLAVDSNSVLNRAYYGVRPLTTREGQYTNGIFGFLNMLFKLLDEVRPDAVAFAFDLRAPTFRHKMFDGYKAQRKGMPEELAQQVEPLKELLRSMGYCLLAVEGYEADDILGTLARRCREAGDECVIATGDRDSFQLVGDGVTVRLAFTRGGQSGAEEIDEAVVRERYGVSPLQMIEVKALMGDASDNIPGVAGIGEKTALALIAQFGSMEGVYAALDDPAIKNGVRTRLAAGRESAEMSRKLAEIDRFVPLDLPPDALRPAEADTEALARLLDRLELRSILTRLGLDAPAQTAQTQTALPPISCRFNDPSALDALLEEETLWVLVRWAEGEPVALGVLGAQRAALFDGDAPSLRTHLLTLSRADAALSLPDSKDWYRFLYRAHAEVPLVAFDPTLAGYLLAPLATGYSMAALCAGRTLHVPALVGADALPDPLAELCADLVALPPLCAALRQELIENDQLRLLTEMEQPLARVLASMETAGFSLDADGLRRYGEELDADLAELTARIYQLAAGEFNINSPKQLGEVLFDRLGLPTKRKNKSGYSTDADVLDSLRQQHPIVDDVLAYRKLAKLKSTYVDGLLSKIAPDGRVHTLFRQTETRTGRISSTEPNLQNIPIRTERGSRLRRFFVARPGCLLVDADYSQIELRVLAHIANDPAMIDAFVHGQDIHRRTAAQVFDMPEDFVTPQMRSRAKAVNFGIVYGIGAFSLAQDIGVSVAEADHYIHQYLETYAGVRSYMESAVDFAREHGYAQTLFGRRRPLPELTAANRNTKSFGERVAMNTPIQGSAADLIKLAMIRVFDRLRAEDLHARLILQVHDELLVEAPAEEAPRVAALLTDEMQHAADLLVPLIAQSAIGSSWLEAK